MKASLAGVEENYIEMLPLLCDYTKGQQSPLVEKTYK